jgi:hypothetical protein
MTANLDDDFVDLDDFEKFKTTNVEDLPTPQDRNIRAAASIENCLTAISRKRIEMKITDYEIRKINFFKKDIVYTISTEIQGQLMKWNVQRTDEDFSTLRRLLVI